MKKIVTIINICIFQIIFAQDNYKKFNFFYRYDDYINNTVINPEIIGNVKEINNQYIKFSDYLYDGTKKKAKEARLAWAVSDGKDIYFNMSNASYIYTYNVFAKFDIINDNYMVVLLDEKKESEAISYNAPYGGGIVGNVLNMKPKSSWKDRNGSSFKILLIDKKKPIRIGNGRSEKVVGYLVDTKKILELSNYDNEVIEKLKSDNFKLEDFLVLIN